MRRRLIRVHPETSAEAIIVLGAEGAKPLYEQRSREGDLISVRGDKYLRARQAIRLLLSR